MNFSGKFGSEQIIWYPASGDRFRDGSLDYVGYYGHYWSASPNNYYAYDLSVSNSGGVSPSRSDLRACGQSVRCLQE